MGSPHWADAVRGCGVPPCGVDHARCLAPRILSGSLAVSRSHEVWSRDAPRCAVVVHEGQAGGGLRGGLGDGGWRGGLETPSEFPDASGGMTPQKRWRGVDYFPFKVLHKKWQYHLFTMLKHRLGTRAIKDKIDALWRKYSQGLVAYFEAGKVPACAEVLGCV